jgi:anti-anti-sigma regulatory factor
MVSVGWWNRTMANEDVERTETIRRRIQREYVVLSAPAVLDADTAVRLVDDLFLHAGDCDLVIDLRAVLHCDDGVIDLLDRASRQLDRVGATVTLSHPSASFERLLGDHRRRRSQLSFDVRRPRTPRALRHSMRGDV